MTRHIHWEILITCNCQDAEGSSTKCNDECSKFTDSMTGCGVYIVHCCTLLYTAVHMCLHAVPLVGGHPLVGVVEGPCRGRGGSSIAQHQLRLGVHHDRFAVLLLGLRGSLGLRLFQLVHLVGVLPHDLYEVGHGEVHDVVFPSQLQDDVWVEEVAALEPTSSEAVVRLVLEEIRQQVLGNFSIFGLSCILHRIFEEVVFFA